MGSAKELNSWCCIKN